MKKLFLLTIIMLLIFVIFLFSPLNISATLCEEINLEDDNIGNLGDENVGNSVRSIPGGDNNTDEPWYSIKLDDNGIPNTYPDIDYSVMPELITRLKPGDIIYEPNGAFIGDIVGHIAMVYDIVYDESRDQHYVIIIESYTDGVTYGLMTPARFESKDVQIYRLTDATETQIQGAIAWAQSQYDAAWFFKAWKKTEPGLIPVWYCAELIWAAYYHQGIYLDQDDNNNWGSIVFPYEIAAYQNAIPILHDSGEDYQAELYSNGDTYHTYYFNGKTYTEEHDYEEYQHRYRKCRVCEYIDYNTNNLEYQEISNTLHSCECTVCGHIFYEEHTIKYTIISNENHSKNCIYCGYTLTEVHNYQAYNSCYEKCADCGHKNQIAEHDFTYGYETNPNDVNNTHYAYCECGLRISQEHSFSSSG